MAKHRRARPSSYFRSFRSSLSRQAQFASFLGQQANFYRLAASTHMGAFLGLVESDFNSRKLGSLDGRAVRLGGP